MPTYARYPVTLGLVSNLFHTEAQAALAARLAALATIEVMSEPGFLDNVTARGRQLLDGLADVQGSDPGVRQVRGVGLMVATVFDDPARVGALMQHCLREGHLILMSAGSDGTVLRWMPPLVVTAAEIDEALQSFAAALKATA
jgi:acetylornithine/succinyldiaminopimelate/putrescine aminotransferase